MLNPVRSEYKSLESSERTEWTLIFRGLAFVLQVVAPHLVEFAALGAGVAEQPIPYVCLVVVLRLRTTSCKHTAIAS